MQKCHTDTKRKKKDTNDWLLCELDNKNKSMPTVDTGAAIQTIINDYGTYAPYITVLQICIIVWGLTHHWGIIKIILVWVVTGVVFCAVVLLHAGTKTI